MVAAFLLFELIAILQYLCDKFVPDSKLKPTEKQQREIVKYRLCFNSSFSIRPLQLIDRCSLTIVEAKAD